MPATDNSAIQITINVVDGATGETISRVTNSLNQLGEAGARNGQKLKQGMAEAGKAGESVGPAVGKGMKEAGQHSLSALDNVRLLRDDLGIRIPRAMESVIANSKVAMGVIGALGGGLVALGAIEVLIRLADQAYQLYKRVTDVNAEMRKYSEQAGRTSSQKLFETKSIEEVNALLKQTEGTLDSIDKKRREAGVGKDNSGSLMQYVKQLFSPVEGTDAGMNAAFGVKNRTVFTAADSARESEAQSRKDLLRESRESIDAKRAVDQQEVKATEDGLRLTGRAATAAAERNAIILARLRQTQQLKEAIYGRDSVVANNALIKSQNPKADEAGLRKAGYQDVPVVAPDIGAQDAADAIAKARGEAGAKGAKQTQDEMREAAHATAETRMAGMEGEALALAKELEQLRQLAEKAREVGMSGAAYQAQRSAIEQKYFQEQTRRMREEDARSAELEAGANVGGLTGLAKLDAERDAKLGKLQDEASQGKFTNVDTLSRNTAAINKGHDNEAGQQQGNFTDRLTELDAGRADRYASESERITQSADKTVREIQRAWTDMYGQLAPLDARRVQSQQALNAEIVKINADAARQRQEAGQRVEDETRKLEDQAHRESLPKYQQQTAAIVDDYNERIAKLEQLRAKDADNADRYRRQEIAEEQIKNGKLIEQQRALQQELAGKLGGFFTNPLEALKHQGEQAASQYAAQFLLGNKATRGAATALATGGKGGALPSILGSGWGGKHPATFDHGASQAGSGTHNDNPLPATTRNLPVASSTAIVTASTATISVGAATFTGVGSASSSGGTVRTRTGTYAPTGGGGYFNLGQSASASSGGDAGASSFPGLGASSPSSTPDAGSSGGGDILSTVDSGISTAKSVTSATKEIGTETGIFKKIGGASKNGLADLGSSAGSDGGGDITDEAGASAATDASIADAGSAAGSDGAGASAADGAGAAGGAAGAISGGIGLFSAIEGKGGFGGALQGAMAGAQLGAEFGGPVGAVIGAVGGAVLGFIGFGARAKAEKYNNRTVKPRIANDLQSFEAGQTDYSSAFDDLTHLITEAKIQTRQMGSGASSYYNSVIDPEIRAAQDRMTREQKAGRSQFGMTAAQFHQGGFIRDFGSMSTTDGQGWIHAQRGEAVLNQQAAMTHADAAMLMNAGASRSQMADYYGGGSGTRAADSSSGSEIHLHVHAIDTRCVKQFFDDHKHSLRDSLNASYAENSGGGDYA